MVEGASASPVAIDADPTARILAAIQKPLTAGITFWGRVKFAEGFGFQQTAAPFALQMHHRKTREVVERTMYVSARRNSRWIVVMKSLHFSAFDLMSPRLIHFAVCSRRTETGGIHVQRLEKFFRDEVFHGLPAIFSSIAPIIA